MILVWYALLGASVVTALLLALLYITAGAKRPAAAMAARWGIRLWVVNFVVCLALLYVALPAMTGPYWGGQWLLWPLLISGFIAFGGGSLARIWRSLDTLTEQINSDEPLRFGGYRWRKRTPRDVKLRASRRRTPATSGRAGLAAIAVALCVAVLVNGGVSLATTWLPGGRTALARLAAITTEPASASLPATDVHHLVVVSREVALYIGQQALTNGPQNVSSLYHTELTEYTLQAVKGHLYWIAPLVYDNVWANFGAWESPGYVAVDAENPDTLGLVRTQYHMRYLMDSVLNRGLLRHVYLSGYTTSDLVEPTFQVDDNWNPYYTVDVMRPTRGFTGETVDKVLLVDPQSGGITAYTPAQTPAWVDRTMPASAVQQYVSWWGQYSRQVGFDANGSNPQVPTFGKNEGPYLTYTTIAQPTWMLPMASAGSTGTTTGVVLFDTRSMSGRYYAIPGLGITDDVKTLIEGSLVNTRGYSANFVQLCEIDGEPTWVATMTQTNATGVTFQGVAMVDALQQRGENVIMQPTKDQALAAYAQWLAVNSPQAPNPGPSTATVTVKGRVARISSATDNGASVYFLLLDGQTRIFKASLTISAELPLVQRGDMVQLAYEETGQSTVTVTSFTDLSVQLTTPTPSASPTAGPTASPTATPKG
ncbi:MAG TPA: hypothetical protein VGR88_07865 [Ktedonobacterales bacterium]|nr:hypothetical protein [Ktedonobacterales bacterium]